MTLGRIVLGLTGLLFAGYGLACLLRPDLPAGYAGIELLGASGATEVAAMYGGLQLAMGILFLRTAVRLENVVLGLIVLVTLVGGLAVGRAFGLMVHGPSAYNVGAIVYEASTAVLGIVSMRLIARGAVTAAANP
jgi:hypothetical protein